MSISFKEFMAANPEEKRVRLGDMVDATVKEIKHKERLVVVDGGDGFKSDTSVIALEEFFKEGEINSDEDNVSEAHQNDGHPALEVEVGSVVPVIVKSLDNGYGEVVFSREEARRMLAWDALQDAFDNKKTVQGVVTGKVYRGFTVDLGILKGFLPASLVDSRYLDEINALTHTKFDFNVITLEQQRNNIVLSQGQVSRDVLLETLEVGQKVQGYVKSIMDYGAFLNLGGIDGLLHNVQIAWKRTTAREYFKNMDLKEPIEVQILQIQYETSGRPRISLGRKQLTEDPWTHIAERYHVNMRLDKRKVTHIKEYGCFVEIEPGVEGLVHTTEMDWTNRSPNPHTVIEKLQDEEGRIDVVILDMEVDLDSDVRRLSLGIKQCTENPWQVFAEQHEVGDRVKGTVRSITDLGLFVHLESNIDGLVHHKEIRTGVSGEEATRQFKKGDVVETIILSIEPDRERVALSMRDIDDSLTAGSENKAQNNMFQSYADLESSDDEEMSEVTTTADIMSVEKDEELIDDGENNELVSSEEIAEADDEIQTGEPIEAALSAEEEAFDEQQDK